MYPSKCMTMGLRFEGDRTGLSFKKGVWEKRGYHWDIYCTAPLYNFIYPAAQSVNKIMRPWDV